MKFRLSNLILIASLAITLLSGCAGGSVRARLNEAEAMLDERPVDALSILEGIDSTSLRLKPRRMRHVLLRAIALDKNHKSDSGFAASVGEAARWYVRFGNRHDRLRSCYYYGDLLRDVGRYEEAAVQFMRSEKEAISLEDWFYAGMSARSLYYVFGDTFNRPEELSCITRAVEYFHRAGMDVHEDDARIKMAVACYDNYQLSRADSIFNESISVAIERNDTTRWTRALVESVYTMLLEEPFKPDSAKARIFRAWELGRAPSCRTLADMAFSEALLGNKGESEKYLSAAYSTADNRTQYFATVYRDYQINLVDSNYLKAFPLLYKLYSDTDSVAIKALEQSVVGAQKMYLESFNERLSNEKKMYGFMLLLTFLFIAASSAVLYLFYKKKRERRLLIEAERSLEMDRYRLASDELASLGLKSLDKISHAYYTAGNNYDSAVLRAYKDEIEKFRSDRRFIDKFLENVDQVHGGIITKLRVQVPELGEKQVQLFAYLISGFSYTTIGVIFNVKSKQYLYNRRQDLIRTIKNRAPVDEIIFLDYLPNRSTNPEI